MFAARSKAKAFTLVELLVVIGIIALLISILLPSLARARQAAITLQCSSNVRTIGQALMFYDNDYHRLPPNQEWVPAGQGGYGARWLDWPTYLTTSLGGNPFPNGDPTGHPFYAKVFTCPAATMDYNFPWNNGMNHYVMHLRLAPGMTYSWPQNDVDPFMDFLGTPRPMSSRSLSSVTDSASAALVWDGPQVVGLGGNCGEWGALDKSQWGWGHFFCREGWQQNASWENLDNQFILWDAGEGNWPESLAEVRLQNVDNQGGDWWVSPAPGARFRHNNNDTINVLFCDGHAESIKIGDFKRSMVLPNFK